MPDLYLGASFFAEYRRELTAAATFLGALALAELLDRALSRRTGSLRAALGTEQLSPELRTRLRLVRRLVFAAIVMLGAALALAQFPDVRRLATGLLASSAVLGIVVGFAARQTLANAIAGILIAITQPIRVGDVVSFEGRRGQVEDLALSYTTIRLADGACLLVPNERLVQTPLENHTLRSGRVLVEAAVWVARDIDLDRATRLPRSRGLEVQVGATDKDAVELVALLRLEPGADWQAARAELLRAWLADLATEPPAKGPEVSSPVAD